MSKPILEKELIEVFEISLLEKIQREINSPKLRVYAYEFPIKNNNESGNIDMILENHIYGNNTLQNPLILLEFKRNHIKYGAVDQLNFYKKEIAQKLHRKEILLWIVTQSFSVHEISEASKNNIRCLQIDTKGIFFKFLN
jgi:hypothetical protein